MFLHSKRAILTMMARTVYQTSASLNAKRANRQRQTRETKERRIVTAEKIAKPRQLLNKGLVVAGKKKTKKKKYKINR